MLTRISLRTFEHFVEVARLIAGDEAPEWLPRLLHSWMCDLHRARFVDSQRPTRTRMRRRLELFEAAARACASLITEAGVTKPGSGRARPVAAVSPQTYCALIILETWKFIHGMEPSPRSRRAGEAAEAYWRAAGGDARSVGEEPLARWRYHFQLARKNKATTMTAEYRRHLVENDRSRKLLHGFSEEAA